MEESPRGARRPREMEENLECKAQFINMELVMKKLSNGWEESPRLRRGVQGALESQDEFEFIMSNFSAKDDVFEPAMEAAPADELFFRGQLLPLEHDPRVQLVHSLSGMQQRKQFGDSSGCGSAAEDELAMKIAYAEAFPFAAYGNNDRSLLHTSEGSPLKSGVDEEAYGQGVVMSTAAVKPHKSEGGMDAGKGDSRSSSFRSLQSSYWGSGEKDSRDSSSSSRCSNGSSQDGCLHGAERKEMQQNKAMATNRYVNGNLVDAIDEADDGAQCSKPALPTAAKTKKWSWRALFNGLRKASKIWVDDRGEEFSNFAPQKDANGKKKSVFGLVSAGQASKSMDKIDDAGPSGHGREVWRPSQQAASRGKGLGLEEYGKQTCSKSYMGYGGHRGHNYYEGSNGGRPGKERGARLGIIAWNARDSWQKWVKKPLSGKLSAGSTHKHGNEDLPSFNVRAKSLSSTPLSKSPVRRADNVAHTPDFYGSASTSKYISVGLAASCPASMRSSPHHSGVLAVVNKSPSPSSLHDLHTAIQGAIAHCKQSQTADLQ